MKKILFLALSLCGILGAADINNGVAVTRGADYLRAGYDKYREGDYQGAAAEYTNELKRNKENARAYFLRGAAKYSAEDREGALEDFEAAKKLDAGFSKEIERTLRK